MGTGSFRHGPQEIVSAKTHFGVWIDGAVMRKQDLAVASDLQKLGARVMLVGQRLPSSSWDLAFEIPAIAADWQFLVDVIPAQLCAESFARQKGVDPDSFLHCSYIVDGEFGLLPKQGAVLERAMGAENAMVGAVDIGGTKIAVGIVGQRSRKARRQSHCE